MLKFTRCLQAAGVLTLLVAPHARAGPGAAALLQAFTIPVNAISVSLSFSYYVLNPNSDYIIPSPDSLDWTANVTQQARVDILTQSAGAFDVTPVGSGGGLVLTAYQTQPGDPNGTSNGYAFFSQDITSSVTAGGTYQLRLAEANTQGQLLFAIDNVQINDVTRESSPTPEPGTILLLAGGLLVLTARLNSRTRKGIQL